MIGRNLGAYRITSKLGSGGMGTVYAATATAFTADVPAGTPVALKVIHPHLLETPGYLRRFVREASIGRAVRHANVVRTYDADALELEGEQHHFLVMEYVEGQTARALIDEMRRLPEKLCRHIGCEVAKGLAAIHSAGAVHRDLKPENVLITPQHDVKVMDLGVALLIDETVRLSRTGAFVGSVQYAAPEQFSREPQDIDHRADLHALGLLLYELGCGRHPFEHDNIHRIIHTLVHDDARGVAELEPRLSAFYDEVVRTLLAKDPDDRLQSAEEVAQVLELGESSLWWRGRSKILSSALRRPRRRLHGRRETRLYGRDKDLAQLRALYERACAGDGQVVLLEGEAGIGKSRLVDELVEMLRQDGADLGFQFGSYPPSGAASADGAFSTAFREELGPEGAAPYLARMPLLIDAFDAVLEGHAIPPGAESLTRDALGTCFVHVMRALAACRTVVLLIDDLHFAPADALGLFATVALAVPGHRVLLIGTMRPGVPHEWIANLSRLDHVSHSSLSRLGPKDLALLLEESFQSERLAGQLGHRIALMSDGNPFFAFEIVQGLRDGQLIRQTDDGSWDTTRAIERIAVPASLMDMVIARISKIGDDEREVLDVAACCGHDFDPALVGDVVGQRPIPLLRLLARIERTHRLVRSVGVRYVFDHHQIQEAIYGGLPVLLRREYHGALADALEARAKTGEPPAADVDGRTCLSLCEHLLRAEQGERATRYIDGALDHLEAGHLSTEAIALADRALAIPGLVSGRRRVELLLRKIGVLDLLGRRDEERAALDELVPLAERTSEEIGDPALLATTLHALGGYLFGVARYDEAAAAFTRGRDLARESGNERIEGAVTRGLGSVALWQGRYADSRAAFESAVALAQRVGDRRAESSAIGNLGNAFQRVGQWEQARELYERSYEIAREIGFTAGEASALGNLGLAHRRLGHFEDAKAHFERALELCRTLGERRGETSDMGNLGNAYFSLGRYDEARTHHERSLVLAREIGDRRWQDLALHNLANAWSQLGSVTQACELLDRSRAIAAEIGDRGGVDYGDWLRGDLAAWTGDAVRAEELLTTAAESFRAAGSIDEVAGTLVSLSQLLAATGRRGAAISNLEEAVQLVEGTDSCGRAALARCQFAALTGSGVPEAEAALQRCGPRLEHHQRLEARLILWKASADPKHISAARALLDRALANAPKCHHEAMLNCVPTNREVMECSVQQVKAPTE